MSTIKPQSLANPPSTPPIVVRTVHGDAIAVRMELLGQNAAAYDLGEVPKSESAPTIREAG